MISYSTSFVGPSDMYWYHKNGFMEDDIVIDYWCGGHIEIRGLDQSEFKNGRYKYDLPIMNEESWYKFTNWLERFKSKDLLSYDDLISKFERTKNHKIIWFEEDK
jgi:hypothetical protein